MLKSKLRQDNSINIHAQTLPRRKENERRHRYLVNIYVHPFAIVEFVISLSRAQFIFKTERGRENGGEQQPGGQNVHLTRRYSSKTTTNNVCFAPKYSEMRNVSRLCRFLHGIFYDILMSVTMLPDGHVPKLL